MAEERQYGVVKRWTEKGFGFIERPDFGDSIFCHSRETPDRAGLVPGSKVSFVYENDEKGGKAKEVLIEEAAVEDESVREMGTIKRWNAEKGFGFIGRANGGDDAFVHKKDYGGTDPVQGQAVSFVFEDGPKGASAKNVREEEGGTVVEEVREMGTIKRWNAEKGFGFIGRANGGDDAFVHKKDCGGKDLVQGQGVSFVFEDGPKGASAKNVREEGEMTMEEPIEEEEGEREFGKVKDYNQEKGFTFIGRCAGGDDIFGHKREFGNIEPYVGQPVSFVLENTEKGDTAKKIREEESVPEFVLSDEGREFGTVKNFNKEKGFGFIVRKKGGDDAHVHEKQCNGLTLEKDMCVSFVCEDSGKGPAAKDLREEDPARVARVTAKVHYGKVERYLDPPETKPDSGYGFITPLNTTSYGSAPKKYYFHMSEIETPDEYGGIEPGTGVSYIITTARSGKGVQAVSVTIADPPKQDKENESSIHASFSKLKVAEPEESGDAGDTWGTGGSDAWA